MKSKEEKYLIQSLVYELGNHEYIYSYDCTDALEALGFTYETVNKKALEKAIKIYLESMKGCT